MSETNKIIGTRLTPWGHCLLALAWLCACAGLTRWGLWLMGAAEMTKQ